MKSKKVLALTLAAAMMFGSALTVSAASGGSAGSSGSVSEEVWTAPEESESSGGASASEAEEVMTSAGAKVTVGGVSVQTTTAGAYAAKSVAGVAVITPAASLKANLGLSGSQTPYIMVFDTDIKKSSLAMGCINAAVESLGGSLVTTLNIDLGAKENGKWVALSNGSAGMAIGLPKGADTSKTYSVVCVQPGGVITILQDQDNSPATVTFEVKAGLGTYGIVAK